MRPNIAFSLLLSLSLVRIAAADDVVKAELRLLQGTWSIARGEVGSEVIDFEKLDEADPTRFTWRIEGDQLSILALSKRADRVRMDIDPNAMPKHLDLIPLERKDDADIPSPDYPRISTRAKFLYEVDGDTLKIAQTFGFYPSTPERERELAIQYANKRPHSFDPKTPQPPDGKTTVTTHVLVLTFKRAKME